MIREERLVELRDLDADFLGERDPAWGAAASESRIALVHDALRRHGGNKAAAARELGLHRQELYRLLERHQPRTPGGVTRTA
jgi:transcriptional regulator of acetoin/glycerol metabolism